MLSGDGLTVQTFIWSIAISCATLGASLAGWSHRLFVKTLFFLCFLLILIGSFWSYISKYVSPFMQNWVPGPFSWLFIITCVTSAFYWSEAYKKQKSGIRLENSRRPGSNLVNDAFIYGYSHNVSPRFSARFSKRGREAVFYLEYSYLPIGVISPVSWSARRKFEIQVVDRFAVDQEITFPIVFDTSDGNRIFWHLGQEGGQNEVMLDRAEYKGRITITHEDIEQHVYFIAHVENGVDSPNFTGEHMFNQANEWADYPASR